MSNANCADSLHAAVLQTVNGEPAEPAATRSQRVVAAISRLGGSSRFRLSAFVFTAALATDLATKALLVPVTYHGVLMPAFLPNLLWVAIGALLVLRMPSRPITAAAALVLAGLAGNLLDQTATIDFSSYLAITLADIWLLVGMLTMEGLLVSRLIRLRPARP